MAARAEEIRFVHAKGVYIIADKQLAFTETGKPPISVRARLVAEEIRHEANDGSMYAATPPLESIKWFLSLAASAPHFAGSNKELK
eukprot:989171-Heterocapsa_arctica.AAC.1